jgi:hypothetical protein
LQGLVGWVWVLHVWTVIYQFSNRNMDDHRTKGLTSGLILRISPVNKYTPDLLRGAFIC